jgi:hypothetical protein
MIYFKSFPERGMRVRENGLERLKRFWCNGVHL